MKKENTSLIKQIIISVLIIVSLILAFFIIFYDKISLGKIVPQSEEYKISEEMQEDMDETYSNESQPIVTTYYIDAADLKQYERTKEYNKGKKNPFAEESIATNENTIIENDTSIEQENGNFYEDDGTK